MYTKRARRRHQLQANSARSASVHHFGGGRERERERERESNKTTTKTKKQTTTTTTIRSGHSFRSTCDKLSESAGEQRGALYEEDQ